MKIAQFPNSSASRQWRLEDPGNYLRRLGHEVVLFTEPVTREMCEYFDVFVTQGMIDKDGIALLYEYQQEHGKKIVVDQDDDLRVDKSNPHAKDHEVTGAVDIVKKTIEIANLVTTTTDYLQKKLLKYNKNTQVFPNYMDMKRWDLPKHQNAGKDIRILWCGSITHLEDLKMVMPVLYKIQKDFPQVKYIFMGDPRLREHVQGLNAEVMLGVPFEAYPTKLHSIGADIAIAPLVDNEFNKCKSNIKSLEYGIAKYPGVYSEIVYNYRGFDGFNGTECATLHEWYLALRNYIVCPNLRKDIAEKNYHYVKSWYNLEDRIKSLEKMYKLTTKV